MAQGENGYIDTCHKIVSATKTIEAAIREHPSLSPDLSVIGKPIVCVVAFTSKTLNIYDLADSMSAKGWHLNALQNPPAIHVAVTLPIVSATERLIGDLAAAVEGEKEKERVRIVEGKGTKGHAPGTSAALYGVSLPYLLSSLVLRTSTHWSSSLLKYLGRGKSTK